jgi:hypothetical protein
MATIVANPVFDATKLAESLHAAMAGTGTRESDLIEGEFRDQGDNVKINKY